MTVEQQVNHLFTYPCKLVVVYELGGKIVVGLAAGQRNSVGSERSSDVLERSSDTARTPAGLGNQPLVVVKFLSDPLQLVTLVFCFESTLTMLSNVFLSLTGSFLLSFILSLTTLH